jgi:hypothetical protein
MRKLLFNVVGVLLFLGMIVGVVVFALKSPSSELEPRTDSPAFPTDIPNAPQDTTSVVHADAHTDAGITEVFKDAASGGETTLEASIIVEDYALQPWKDGTGAGGETLLQRSATGAWRIIAPGGGAWSESDLISLGVPNDIAARLLNGRTW